MIQPLLTKPNVAQTQNSMSACNILALEVCNDNVQTGLSCYTVWSLLPNFYVDKCVQINVPAKRIIYLYELIISLFEWLEALYKKLHRLQKSIILVHKYPHIIYYQFMRVHIKLLINPDIRCLFVANLHRCIIIGELEGEAILLPDHQVFVHIYVYKFKNTSVMVM